jgi:hypothetical protein
MMGIKTWWAGQRARRQQAQVSRGPTGNTARRWAFCGVVPIAALFVAVGVWRNWTTAYLVLIGSETPADAHASAVAVLLSIGGYLIVPLIVGTGVAGYFQRSVEKKTRLDLGPLAEKGLPPTGTGTVAQETRPDVAATQGEVLKATGSGSRAATKGESAE